MAGTFLLETASPLSKGLDPALQYILIDGIHNVTNLQNSIGKEDYVEA